MEGKHPGITVHNKWNKDAGEYGRSPGSICNKHVLIAQAEKKQNILGNISKVFTVHNYRNIVY